jgi:hypothetical protein
MISGSCEKRMELCLLTVKKLLTAFNAGIAERIALLPKEAEKREVFVLAAVNSFAERLPV